MTMHRTGALRAAAVGLLAWLAAVPAQAQIPPDAGKLLTQLRDVPDDPDADIALIIQVSERSVRRDGSASEGLPTEDEEGKELKDTGDSTARLYVDTVIGMTGLQACYALDAAGMRDKVSLPSRSKDGPWKQVVWEPVSRKRKDRAERYQAALEVAPKGAEYLYVILIDYPPLGSAATLYFTERQKVGNIVYYNYYYNNKVRMVAEVYRASDGELIFADTYEHWVLSSHFAHRGGHSPLVFAETAMEAVKDKRGPCAQYKAIVAERDLANRARKRVSTQLRYFVEEERKDIPYFVYYDMKELRNTDPTLMLETTTFAFARDLFGQHMVSVLGALDGRRVVERPRAARFKGPLLLSGSGSESVHTEDGVLLAVLPALVPNRDLGERLMVRKGKQACSLDFVEYEGLMDGTSKLQSRGWTILIPEGSAGDDPAPCDLIPWGETELPEAYK